MATHGRRQNCFFDDTLYPTDQIACFGAGADANGIYSIIRIRHTSYLVP